LQLEEIMGNDISLHEYKKNYREVVKQEEKRDFIIHLIVYVFVNILFLVINLLYSPQHLWFFYPLIGWGIGIAMHYVGVLWIEKSVKQREAKAEYMAREARYEQKS